MFYSIYKTQREPHLPHPKRPAKIYFLSSVFSIIFVSCDLCYFSESMWVYVIHALSTSHLNWLHLVIWSSSQQKMGPCFFVLLFYKNVWFNADNKLTRITHTNTHMMMYMYTNVFDASRFQYIARLMCVCVCCKVKTTSNNVQPKQKYTKRILLAAWEEHILREA